MQKFDGNSPFESLNFVAEVWEGCGGDHWPLSSHPPSFYGPIIIYYGLMVILAAISNHYFNGDRRSLLRQLVIVISAVTGDRWPSSTHLHWMNSQNCDLDVVTNTLCVCEKTGKIRFAVKSWPCIMCNTHWSAFPSPNKVFVSYSHYVICSLICIIRSCGKGLTWKVFSDTTFLIWDFIDKGPIWSKWSYCQWRVVWDISKHLRPIPSPTVENLLRQRHLNLKNEKMKISKCWQITVLTFFSRKKTCPPHICVSVATT